MKKIILIILFLPISVFSQFYKGEVTFNDGTTKTGLLEIPNYEDKKIKFKANTEAKVEKFKVEDVKKFDIVNDKSKVENYVTLNVGNNKLFNPKKFNIDEKKSFVKIVKQGRISIYLIHYSGSSSVGGSKQQNYSYDADTYYLQRENENFAFAIGTHRYDLSFMVGINLKAVVEINFKEICPEFVKKINESSLISSEFSKIVAIYEQSCTKQ